MPGSSSTASASTATSATTAIYYSQLAIQGPQALATLQKLTRVDLNAIKNYWFVWGTVCGIPQCADLAHGLHRRRWF